VNEALAYLAGVIALVWGVMHIMPTRNVVAGYGPLSEVNRLVLTMEWVAEGITYIFMALLLALVTLRGGARNDITVAVYGITAAMFVVMAVWTQLTGARSSVIFFKICPFVLSAAAILLVAAIAL
jgi:hypothetical protein